MDRKRYEFSLFLMLVAIMVVYTFFLGLNFDYNKTGLAVKEAPVEASQNNIYAFLQRVSSNPGKYTLVFGRHATDYELSYGTKIASSLHTKLAYDNDMLPSENLIVIGNRGTNLLLDKLIMHPYSGQQAVIEIFQNNLVILVNNENQAKMAAETILNFKSSSEKLSPSSLIMGSNFLPAYLVSIIVIIAVICFFFVEKSRKKVLSEVSQEERKIEILKDYIVKYMQEGYPLDQISSWLASYGFSQSQLERAIGELKNA
jgi:hypothetical protein